MKKLLELEPRMKIFQHILKSPGVYFRELQKSLNMATGQLEHHLKYLEKSDVIVSIVEEGHRRFFASSKVTFEERKILPLLRQKVPRKILLFLLQKPYSRHVEICKALEKSGSTITKALRKLINKELVVTSGKDKAKEYRVIDEEKILRLFILYRASYSNRALSSFLADLEEGVRRAIEILETK
ncbi:MAG: winged helix-turn-helix transcriptional regulator [Candidatus Thermoplasmatota archaeon]|nr:winged helix-turn-helix transcriptional regulator [Candidatus Thermoplasmatota archaeon]